VPNHVLLIEDNELARDALRMLLQVSGHRVSVAGTVAEALAVARAGRPDLLLVDLTLPDGDGLDIVRELLVEENPPTFVALTGHDEPEVASRCLAAGCVSVIVKPVSSSQLLATVGPLLARRG
jgi:DNA-binding response OmpR family regulator